ncbi:helix-turn-helix domain-containing protein [Gaiella sp.]|jgi:excisionase family DNA binding protein|uniref:helix-turn-helix domain-containing protein n=1 Tax=Gaiella sp. TaxID=2663207 RepID=UPI002E343464|nr:helix-turn-helix domain-containing protein [Gaiella sp.]HEX5583259.1 helix-turn-helix domain-containing protein [Gaiella sp.]
MLTVPEAARLAERDPETIRRWIRSGRLPARKVGTQHVIEESDLDAMLAREELPIPESWGAPMTRKPLPSVVAILRSQRAGH